MSKKTADPTVYVKPVLGDTKALFPPSADPVPEVAGAAVHMKLPTFSGADPAFWKGGVKSLGKGWAPSELVREAGVQSPLEKI